MNAKENQCTPLIVSNLSQKNWLFTLEVPPQWYLFAYARLLLDPLTTKSCLASLLVCINFHSFLSLPPDSPFMWTRYALEAGNQEREKCEHWGSTGYFSDKCWIKHPEVAPDWFKQKMKEQAMGKGKSAEQARKFRTKLAIARDDDFVDNNSTHISA